MRRTWVPAKLDEAEIQRLTNCETLINHFSDRPLVLVAYERAPTNGDPVVRSVKAVRKSPRR